MSDRASDSPAWTQAASEPWLPGPKPPDEGWTRRKFTFVLVFVLAFHLSLVFLLGTKKPIPPRAMTNVPHLQLTDNANEFIALGDPTLFARPNVHDLVTAFWRQIPAIRQPSFDWPAPPGYLTNAAGELGSLFRDFIQSSRPPEASLNFKPEPRSILPEVAGNDSAAHTTLQITGDLAQRPLLSTTAAALPSLPRNDVLGPTTIQVLVNPDGNVASSVVLEPNPNHDHEADQLALQLARQLRFAATRHLTFGNITFGWHTVPLLNTNQPGVSLP